MACKTDKTNSWIWHSPPAVLSSPSLPPRLPQASCVSAHLVHTWPHLTERELSLERASNYAPGHAASQVVTRQPVPTGAHTSLLAVCSTSLLCPVKGHKLWGQVDLSSGPHSTAYELCDLGLVFNCSDPQFPHP